MCCRPGSGGLLPGDPTREADPCPKRPYRLGRGRTLDEAVDAALIELKESRRNVDIKVISEGSEETIVEVTVIDPTAANPESPAPANGKAEIARGLVEGL